MKYILFEKSAVESLINCQFLQSVDFPEGEAFAKLLQGFQASLPYEIKNVYFQRKGEGAFFIGTEVSKIFLVIDLERSHLFDSVNFDETIQIIQKLFRFSIRYWNKQAFTSSEMIIPESNNAIVFPLQRWSTNPFRVVIARDPDSSRMSQRDIRQLLLVYKCGRDGGSARNEQVVLSNLRSAVSEYVSVAVECKRALADALSQADVGRAIHPLDFYETCELSEEKKPYMSFNYWQTCLTKTQHEFVFDDNINGPVRLQGPAGTGKTLSLILKAIYLLDKAEKNQQECKIIFFSHSKATRNAIRNIFDAISEGRWTGERMGSSQSIEITTLHEYCLDKVIKEIQDFEVLERDAMDSKQLQYFTICEAYKKVYDQSYTTYKPLLSQELKSFIDTHSASPEIICGMLQHEFSVMIKGKAGTSLEKYRKLPSLSSGLPVGNEDDKGFTFQIFSEYQSHLEKAQQYDTDDIVLSAVQQLDSPIWRRRRKQSAFDYVFIDEAHLFNLNEMLAFHFFTKDSDQYPIVFSIDISQAIGDQGSETESYLSLYSQHNASYKKELALVFRCSQYITDLAMSITASGAILFSHFRNPYRKAESAFTLKQEALSKIPTYEMVMNDAEMIERAIMCAEDMMTSMHCSGGEIAIIAFSEELYNNLLGKLGKENVTEIKQRGDINAKRLATQNRTYVLSMPEYIGGLEFFGVILVGVDDGRVPPSTREDISQNYLSFSAYNKLYVSVTRAKYQINILGANDFGKSRCLDYSIEHKTVCFNE